MTGNLQLVLRDLSVSLGLVKRRKFHFSIVKSSKVKSRFEQLELS